MVSYKTLILSISYYYNEHPLEVKYNLFFDIFVGIFLPTYMTSILMLVILWF